MSIAESVVDASRPDGSYELPGVGLVRPGEYAGAARFLHPFHDRLMQDPQETSYYEVNLLMMYRGADHTEPLMQEWDKARAEAHATGQEPWHPLDYPTGPPKGLQMLSGLVVERSANGANRLIKVPPALRREALRALARVCGGLLPTVVNVAGDMKFPEYLGAPDGGEYPESRLEPVLGSISLALHDRYVLDHILGALTLPPVATTELRRQIRGALVEADEGNNERALGLCDAFNRLTPMVKEGVNRAVVLGDMKEVPQHFSQNGFEVPPKVDRTAHKQLKETVTYLRDARRDLHHLPAAHLAMTPRSLRPAA